jgi:thiamine phosphate synthase YjbQ (UPF0047 family)
VNTQEHRLDTGGRRVLDVTELVLAFCSSDGRDGLVNVFVPHATAGVALMETGSGSEEDLQELLERILPRDDRYRHRHGSIGHGGDHLLPVVVSPSVSIPVDAMAALGTGSASCGRPELRERPASPAAHLRPRLTWCVGRFDT